MAHSYQIAFWNLENLFDVEDSPLRTEKLRRAIGKSIKGWTQALLGRKISQLAAVIQQMNDGKGPDILGVCEIENAHVMELLVQALAPLGRNYAIAHHDMEDRRGIDVGFIYDGALFTKEAVFSHFIIRRSATRDLLQVNFRTQAGRLLVVVGNHWPSRSAGKLESDGYRFIAGETLAYFHERIWAVHGKDTPVLAMGDFNDEPFDRSLTDYARSNRDKTKVIRSTSPRFLNLMWPLMGQGSGTLYFNNFPNMLDQFLANENMLKSNSPVKVDTASVQIFHHPPMVNGGLYPSPIPFGGMGKPVNKNGFSDHYPILVKVTEKG
jgi:endonuclease/exonuclease/phosphatase family metal-dependent hydrolase